MRLLIIAAVLIARLEHLVDKTLPLGLFLHSLHIDRRHPILVDILARSTPDVEVDLRI